jgi:uncharacterized membrane protein SirB2
MSDLLNLLTLALIVIAVVGVLILARQNMGEPSAEKWIAALFACAIASMLIVMALAQIAQKD